MDKTQVANWNRQLKIRKVRLDNASVPVSAVVQRVLDKHEALLATVEALLDSPVGRSQGATLKKSAEEKRAVAAALPIANALYLLYQEADDAPQAYALRRTKTGYAELPAALTLAETKNVLQQAQTLKAQLASEADIGPADLKELATATAAFEALLAAPKTAIEAGKNSRTALGAALKAADKFVESDLRPAVKTLQAKQPGLYAALLQAMRIDDAPGARHDTPVTPAA